MNPEEAVQAHLDLHSQQTIGIHFGTFQLTDEALEEPVRALERARLARGVAAAHFSVLREGETKTIPL